MLSVSPDRALSKKEMAEHVTIVDLIRNDLSMIADNVRVTRFRYIDRIRANGKELLQVSSEICGKLQPSFNDDPGGARQIRGGRPVETARRGRRAREQRDRGDDENRPDEPRPPDGPP